MADRTRVNFHCHSDLSDGAFPPETVAAMLARDGVRYAALTDHDTVDGWARFSDALQQRGVGCISGVEISARWGDNEIHLLAYGFNPQNPELRQTLHAIRKHRRIGLQTVFASLRTSLKSQSTKEGTSEIGEDDTSPRTLPPFDAAEIIRRVHAAGGLVFLAHPRTLSSDIEEIGRSVRRLKEAGLDGIEAYYGDYSTQEREELVALARSENLLLSAGTDLHGPSDMDQIRAGIDFPTSDWKDFRNALRNASPPRDGDEPVTRESPVLRWKQLLIRVALPVILTIGLFLFANFAVIIPAFEEQLMNRKEDSVRDLTAVAASLLREYADKEAAGEMTREAAQKAALAQIRDLRYGPKKKDYFWIIDTRPTMVMHPYRPELDGEDLSGFEDFALDPEDKKLLFVESVAAVEKTGEGFVHYWWQWKDDPTRIEPKLSHVRLFKPWGWIVGTGIYIDDVKHEISRLTHRLAWTVVLITAVVAGLLLIVVQQSLRLERQRSRAESSLRESHKKYRLLVETASEGTILLLDGKCAFANRAMLKLLDYSIEELHLLDWHDLLPGGRPEEHTTVRYLTDLLEGRPTPLEHTGQLRRKNGDLVDLELSCQSIDIDDRHGLILSAREVVDGRPVASAQPTVPLDFGQRRLIEELQSSLLFLSEPLSHFGQTMLRCQLDTPIEDVARLMRDRNFSAILVVSESDRPIGIVTDGDLRRRVLAERYDPTRPVHEIMSSPLVSIDQSAPAHEALLKMQESDSRHLALRNVEGDITGIVRRADLVAFHRYASSVVVDEIRRADSLPQVVAARERLPQIVGSLVDVSAKPRSVTYLLSSVHDAVTDRLLRLAMDRLGPPPARFAFLCMGSEGREEETLLTDQDNGIIYEDVPQERQKAANEYFLKLGELVCEWLDTAGYKYCAGGVMARTPQWCAPLRAWQDRFAGWITASEPKDIMQLDMCFDFRCVYGAEELARELRGFVLDRIADRPEFLCHFATNALQYKPPIGFFGKIQVRDEGEHEKVLDIKAAMMPIVKFARLYALRDRLPMVGTIPRLDRMLQLDLLSESSHAETVIAYEFLTGLRLQHQVRMIQSGRPADNHINPKAITHIEEVTLRESLTQIATIQKRIGYDFLGTAEA